MMNLDEAHEGINGIIGLETEPKEGDTQWFPDEETGYEFIYKIDHWELIGETV